MDESKSKPCPFCGGQAAVWNQGRYIYHSWKEEYYDIRCICCGASIPRVSRKIPLFSRDDEKYLNIETAAEAAIKLWNRRANDNEQL